MAVDSDIPEAKVWRFAGASKSKMRKVGERLAAGTMAEDDEECFKQFEQFAVEQVTDVAERLRALAFMPTDRPKNRGTIIEKIQRERSVLTRIHDLVGCRLVLADDDGRIEQYAAVRRIEAALADLSPERVDRVMAPSHGYRAVHVIVWSRGVAVEIQVRTVLQHQWAEIVEKLADVVGRAIRYGGAPDLSEVHEDYRTAAEWLCRVIEQYAELIDRHEYLHADHLLTRSTDEDYEDVKAELVAIRESMRVMLEEVHDLAAGIQ